MVAALFAAGIVCAVAAGCGLGFAADEAGSALDPRAVRGARASEPRDESGSTLDPGSAPSAGRFANPSYQPPEAGSTFDPRPRLPAGRIANPSYQPPEAGSILSPRQLGPGREPEAGSLLIPRRTGRGAEAGSTLRLEAGSTLVERHAHRAANGNLFETGGPDGGNGSSALTLVTRQRLTPFALVLIALGGAALILFTLFKLGMSNPYARELWTRRLDLCCDVAVQLDTFMDAVRREDWDRCQAMLDGLHATNGRRAVLLPNSTNSALFRFLQVAINCRLSAREPEYRRNLENKFALAIEALRKAARQSELLSLENRQFLVDANKSYRSLRDRA